MMQSVLVELLFFFSAQEYEFNEREHMTAELNEMVQQDVVAIRTRRESGIWTQDSAALAWTTEHAWHERGLTESQQTENLIFVFQIEAWEL